MTIFDWLQESMIHLRDAGVDAPRRDCLVLLEDLLQKDRAWVLSHHDQKLNSQQINILNEQLDRRTKREPLAYIRGKAWFYGRFFNVTSDVLIPRPESENFIDLIRDIKTGMIIDIGTGSGVLAVTAALEFPDAKVVAIDNDEKAIEIAQENASKHNVEIEFIKSDLLASKKLHQKLDAHHRNDTVLLVNLPYVPDGMISSPEINHEPKNSLFSGKDGLNHYKKLWDQIQNLSSHPQHILTESLKNQHAELTKSASTAGYKLTKTKVLIQQFEKV